MGFYWLKLNLRLNRGDIMKRLLKRKIIIKNYTDASDYTIFALLDLFYVSKVDQTFSLNNQLYTITKKTTMLKTIIEVR